jgi:hypothetical protein
MVLTQDFTIQQGDSQRIVVPVLDGDDPDDQFFAETDQVDIDATVSESFESETVLHDPKDTNINVVPFGSVDLGQDSFDEIDTIPDSQLVVTLDLPADVTGSFIAGESIVYQIRFSTSVGRRLTPVKGTISVEPAAPF